MVKRRRIEILAIVLVVLSLLALFFACSPIKTDTSYKHYIFNGENARFETRDGRLEFYGDNTFIEVYKSNKTEYAVTGRYSYEETSSTIYGIFDAFEVNRVKKEYANDKRLEYIAGGMSAGDAKKVSDALVESLISDPVYTVYNGYIFKYGAVTGARTGDIFSDLEKFDGEYEMRNVLYNTVTGFEFRGEKIYEARLFEGEYVFDTQVGTYSVQGDFIAIRPDNGTVKEQKYLFATVTLPEFNAENVDELMSGVQTSGSLLSALDLAGMDEAELTRTIEELSNKKMRVLVKDFYTFREL